MASMCMCGPGACIRIYMTIISVERPCFLARLFIFWLRLRPQFLHRARCGTIAWSSQSLIGHAVCSTNRTHCNWNVINQSYFALTPAAFVCIIVCTVQCSNIKLRFAANLHIVSCVYRWIINYKWLHRNCLLWTKHTGYWIHKQRTYLLFQPIIRCSKNINVFIRARNPAAE